MSPLHGRIGLHSWTLDTTPLAEVLRIAREAGYDAVELRHVDFKRCIAAGMSNEQVLAMIRASGIQMCARAAALDCEVMMVAPGTNPAGSLQEAARNFAIGGEIAQKYGLLCALEFNSRHPVVNRLAVAREILALANQPNCGLLIDTYHAQCAGDGGRAFEDVPASDIIAFQFSDVPSGPISNTVTPLDRLPPGKGVVRWREVLQLLMEKGYGRYINYEAPNPAQWSRPPAEVAREGIILIKALLADAAAAARKAI